MEKSKRKSNKLQNFYGTQDLNPDKFIKLQSLINIIREKGNSLNLVEIDTPTIEYRDLLLNKYGEEAESKLIFDLEKTNNSQGSLRYDLTVPFVRFVVQNKIQRMRRLQIGKVFRRDNPKPESGRFTEFYQADCDIVGEYPPLMAEVEIMWFIKNVMKNIDIDDYEIRYNYRENLTEMCNAVGIDNDNEIKKVCATLDKLDKIDWTGVEEELKQVRCLDSSQIDGLKSMLNDKYLSAKLEDFNDKLTKLVNNDRMIFTPELARGLDYYTGIIYEVVVPNSTVKTIIAGGRYDKLIYENTKKKGKQYISAIGVSFGLSRIIMLEYFKCAKTAEKTVYVICRDVEKRIKISEIMRNKGFKVDYELAERKTIKSITYAVKNNFQYCAIYGENGDKIAVKELFNKKQDVLYTLEELESII
jgi:histidyl-tRNA synthetase